ncbi:MAG TPA: M23 family metallopeptidase [Acidimicrobiales bacterium]|nr:M23 family metallopeptidase [Acidimicrobiales bacterium]
MGVFVLMVVLSGVLTACAGAKSPATTSTVRKQPPSQVTAILVRPIHDAQVVLGDDGMDHVEYDLLVVSVFGEPVTLTNVAVIDPAGKLLTRIDGNELAAATQNLYTRAASPVIPPSAAVSVDVDMTLRPGTVPQWVTHRIAYTTPAGSPNAPIIGATMIDGPSVVINHRPAIVIKPPLQGNGWLATTACCKPNVHRDLRLAIDGNRIETGETFAVDWARIKGNSLYAGNGSMNEQFYSFGANVLAVADGTVVFTQNGKPNSLPYAAAMPNDRSDYGGNTVMIRIAPKIFAVYEHLQPGSLTVKVGDVVKAGATIAKLGNSGPSEGPHLHFELLNQPDIFAGRSLPFVIDRYTLAGIVDLANAEPDHLVISPESRQIRSSYPLWGGIQDFP